MGKVENVALMTSGGLAPCLSSSVAYLIQYWYEALNDGKIDGLTIRCYKDGYKGILLGDSYLVPSEQWPKCSFLQDLGGSPIGNSRVKLTNIKDCVARGLVKTGEDPLEVAAQRLIADNVTVLHTIGGDDTNTQAADLSKYILEKYGGKVVVIGMPKTIDNDVVPIKQTFGADTAAEQGALFFKNVVSESTSNPRMLILHECMGRHSGYLTAATAYKYREMLARQDFTEGHVFSSTRQSRDVHAVWIPEMPLNIEAEGERLKKLMDIHGNVNVFMSEGSGVHEIVAELEARGQDIPRDAFGHVKLDCINPGQYFAKRLAELVKAEKTLVQKSGYFARSAASNTFDKELIRKCAEAGVASAIEGISGCMGEDEGQEGCPVRACEFGRIAGGKAFDFNQEWFLGTLKDIGQPY
jgi:pyrophosphate--fructose-6-phosphate 1-phosphotransferase